MRKPVAEDDAPLADFLCQELEKEQFAVQVNARGTWEPKVEDDKIGVLIQSQDVLRGIRSKKPDLPVLIVTAAAKVEERVRGLDAGADDYVAKPFVFAELSARIRAVLRRGSRPARAILQIADLELERITHTVHPGGHEIALSPKEYGSLNFSCAILGSPFPAARLSSLKV